MEKILETLQQVMTEYQFDRFDILGDSECCLCLNEVDGKWITHSVERGKRFGIHSFSSIDKACEDLIIRASKNDEQRKAALSAFSQKIKAHTCISI